MVRKVGKYGVNSGNTLRISNSNSYLRKYGMDSCIIRRAFRRDGDQRTTFDTGLGDDDLKCEGVPFSLNKKGRWSLPDLIKKEILDGDHTDEDFGIQLVERHKISKVTNCISICTTHSQADGRHERSKTHGYMHTSNVLKRRSRYSRRVRRDRYRRGLPVDDVINEEELPTQVRYDVLYPSPSNSGLIRNPKSIKLDIDSYSWDYYANRRRSNRNRKQVSKHVVREALSVLDWQAEDSEEEASWVSDDEHVTNRQPATVTLHDILEQATTLRQLVGLPEKVRRSSGNSSTPITTPASSKDRVVKVRQDASFAESTPTTTERTSEGTPARKITSTVLEPVTVILPFEQITPHALTEKFGEDYIECDSYPRKFVLDISDQVSRMETFKIFKRNVRTVNACLVVTVDGENEMNTLTDSVCKVTLNTNYSENTNSVKIETIFDYMETTMDELIGMTMFFIETLPDTAILRNTVGEVCYRQDKGRKQSHLDELANWSTDSYTADDAFLFKYFTSRGLKEVKDLGYEVVSHFESTMATDLPDASSQNDNFCGVCYEEVGAENPATALIACGHWFCNRCWREHLETKVRNGAIDLPCPEYDCEKHVDAGTALSFVSMPAILKHAKSRHDTEVERLAETRWCPNERCGRVLHVSSVGVKTARCVCGQQCCVDCLAAPHWPADCDSAKLFRRRVVDKGDSSIVPVEAVIGVIVHGKNCPNCKRFVEKNGGCPYMTCVCGRAFCWGCGKDYYLHIHTNCHKYGFNDKHNTVERNINPEDKLSKLKRRRWYKVALVHRVGQHPLKYQKIRSSAKTLTKKLKELITRSDRKGTRVTLDFTKSGKSYTQESDKVPDFLNNIIELYREVSQLVENVAVLLDSNRSKDMINTALQYMVNRLAYFVSVIYELFVQADSRTAIDTLTKMKQVRVHARNAIRAVVNKFTREKIQTSQT